VKFLLENYYLHIPVGQSRRNDFKFSSTLYYESRQAVYINASYNLFHIFGLFFGE